MAGNPYRSLNAIVTAKAETTSGTDVTPTVASNAVLVEAPSSDQSLDLLSTNEVTGSLDERSDIPGGGPGTFQCAAYLKGSGTGGTAPDLGVLLQGCAMAETLTAADVDDTAQAGAASTITLHSGASATNDAYKGMVIVTNGGTGSGQTRVITGYVGSTKVATVTPAWATNPDNTTDFIIYANALYVPASDSLKTLSIYHYLNRSDGGNSRLRKLLGAAGNAQISLAVRQLARAQFNFTGKFQTPTDVSDPGAATYDSTRPKPILSATCYLGGTATKFNQFSLDLGNQVQIDDDPADTYGVDTGGVTRRKMTGRINPPSTLVSTRDVFTAFLAGTQTSLWIAWGDTAGNRVSILLPTIVYTGQQDEDVNGFLHEGIPFQAVGEDTGAYLCFY